MRRAASLILVGLLALAGPARAELSDGERQTIECAATAVVVNASVERLVNLGADLSEQFQVTVATAAEDLFFDADPLIDPGSEGAAELARLFEALVTARDAAEDDGTFATWFPQIVEVVQTCHLAFLNRPEAGQ
ncbi:hypothetical protein [Jannaschia sp. CCS1]|uniref:hypothetical protein n=1 Tax=Jannaschia sp. (strain CCS1) TaxID=290400 RepID=UPI000053D3F7|nr:hypothetical protein [Jannaschia sp. CCS1]ABD53745.1 hypothetical protein Jann_0828 [Jannaschia sp. CCS1]